MLAGIYYPEGYGHDSTRPLTCHYRRMPLGFQRIRDRTISQYRRMGIPARRDCPCGSGNSKTFPPDFYRRQPAQFTTMNETKEQTTVFDSGGLYPECPLPSQVRKSRFASDIREFPPPTNCQLRLASASKGTHLFRRKKAQRSAYNSRSIGYNEFLKRSGTSISN